MALHSNPTGGHSQLITQQSQIKQQLEEELERRVREALKTPPLERLRKRLEEKAAVNSCSTVDYDQLNAHLDLASKEREYRQRRRLRARGLLGSFTDRSTASCSDLTVRTESAGTDRGRAAAYASIPGDVPADSEGSADSSTADQEPSSAASERQCNDSAASESARSSETNLWAAVLQPALPAPIFIDTLAESAEPLWLGKDGPDLFDCQKTPYGNQKWRSNTVVFDSQRSPKYQEPWTNSVDGNVGGSQSVLTAPSLIFESRFESGNLQLARRVGQFEYELLLKTDLYTKRHTQWYYFRVQNALPGIIYKFRITNFLKKDSLYNYGMKPLFYSETDAKKKNIGWIRKGHHIKYSLNTQHLGTGLHSRDMVYYELEWQMEFENANDTCYMAHCYPYTFSDLKRDLDNVLADRERSAVSRREVLCETKAGNSCFLVTVTDFDSMAEKKCIVISARVHPGESNSSWMMKGLLEFITSTDAVAKDLRKNFVFKIIPMLNPDGVIIGNYRCDLSGKDLNRNYRWPEKHSFPTVAYTKLMVERLQNDMEVLVYCDLHGHSKKSNVFMYGCNSPESIAGDTKAYIAERLFPFLISRQAPDVFSFPSCKFKIQKKKESTGRVVMYKQMKIRNSFTLESTFCGTILDRRGSRHFNQRDYQDIGKIFCLGLHEYAQVIGDKGKETEAVIDLTQSIMQRLIKNKASNDELQVATDPASATATQSEAYVKTRFSSQSLARSNERRGLKRSQATSSKSHMDPSLESPWTTTKLSSAVLDEVLSKETSDDARHLKEVAEPRVPTSVTPDHTVYSATAPVLPQENMTAPTAESCTDFLRQIIARIPGGFRGIESESSSDSDSESDAELHQAKTRLVKKRAKAGRKKKSSGERMTTKPAASMKSRSMLELSGSDRRQLLSEPDYKPPPWQRRASCAAALATKELSSASASAKTARSLAASKTGTGSWSGMLPSISSKEHARSAELSRRDRSSAREASGTQGGDSSAAGAGAGVIARPQPKRPPAVKTYQWVNPYIGRTNGGIPCFSERRSLQRAARRMSDALRQSCKDLWNSACNPNSSCSEDVAITKVGAEGDIDVTTLNGGVTDCVVADPVVFSAGLEMSGSSLTLADCDQNRRDYVGDQNLDGRGASTGGSILLKSQPSDGGGAEMSCDALMFHNCKDKYLCSVTCKPLSAGMKAQLLLPALVPRRHMPLEQLSQSSSSSFQHLSEGQALHFQCRTREPINALNSTALPYPAAGSGGSVVSSTFDVSCVERPVIGCASAYVLTRSSEQIICGTNGYRLEENVTSVQYSGAQPGVVQLPPPSMRASTANVEWRRQAVCTSVASGGSAELLYTADLHRRVLTVPDDLGTADLQPVSNRFANALVRRIRLHQQLNSTPSPVLPAESCCPHSSYLTDVLRVHSVPSASPKQDGLSK